MRIPDDYRASQCVCVVDKLFGILDTDGVFRVAGHYRFSDRTDVVLVVAAKGQGGGWLPASKHLNLSPAGLYPRSPPRGNNSRYRAGTRGFGLENVDSFNAIAVKYFLHLTA